MKASRNAIASPGGKRQKPQAQARKRAALALLVAVALFACSGRASAIEIPELVAPDPSSNDWEHITSFLTGTVGSGIADNNHRIYIEDNAGIVVGNANAISVGSFTGHTYVPGGTNIADIYIASGGLVQNNATSGSGGFGTGNNAIECLNDTWILIDGTVYSAGTQNNAEPVNVHGGGNIVHVSETGSIISEHTPALWFQDWTGNGATSDRNTVVNYGTIANRAGGNVIGTSGGNGIDFYNGSTGYVQGDLDFAGGDDNLFLEIGSTITGDIDGGGGANTLTLFGDTGQNPENGGFLPGAIKNFYKMEKVDAGVWSVTGPLEGFEFTLVRDGTLILTANNTGYTGQLAINPDDAYDPGRGATPSDPGAGNNPDAMVVASAQSLPKYSDPALNLANVYNYGILTLYQPTAGTYVGQIVGTGEVRKDGPGITTLDPDAGENLYTGATNVYNGTLVLEKDHGSSSEGNVYGGIMQVNGVFGASGGTTTVYAGAQLEGVGTVDQDVVNSGAIFPGKSNGQPIGTLTIGGNYYDDGGLLVINARLGNDDSPTSKLVIQGAEGTSLSTGTTQVQVVNSRTGVGDFTTNGIQIVEVTAGPGVSSRTAFELVPDFVAPDGKNAVIAGAFYYSLYYGGAVTGEDGHWYLRSGLNRDGEPDVNPTVPIYEAYPHILTNGFNRVGTLKQRVGNREWFAFSGSSHEADRAWGSLGPERGFEVDRGGMWTRVEGSVGKYEPKTSTLDTSYKINMWRTSVGADAVLFCATDGSKLVGGVYGHVGRVNSKISSEYGDGKIHANGYGVGATLTWYGSGGFYVDAQGRYTWMKSKLRAHELINSSLHEDHKSRGYVLSLETGWDIALNNRWSLTPQAQITYSDLLFDTLQDTYGTRVELSHGDSVEGRLGLGFNREKSWTSSCDDTRRLKNYAVANVYHEFRKGHMVSVSGYDAPAKNETTWGGVSLGTSYNWRDDKYSVYGEVTARTSFKSFGKSHIFDGELGFRMSF